MFGQMKNTCLFSKNRFLSTYAIILGAAVFSELLVVLIVKVFCKNDPEITYVQMAPLMSYFAFWIAVPIWGMTDFGKNFDMMVGFGRTRKEFFFSYCTVNFIAYLVYASIFVLIMVADEALCNLLYKGIPCEMDLSAFFLDARTIGATVLIAFFLNIILGALYLKFRAKLFMFVWMVCMCLGIIMRMIQQAIEAEVAWIMAMIEGIVAFFTAPAYVMLTILAVATIFLVMVSYGIVRKREIVSW